MPARRVDTSQKADVDLQQIVDFTRERWGDEQRFRYSNVINRSMGHLKKVPFAGRDRSDLSPDVRSCPAGEHIIFYPVREDHLYIVRILHSSADVASAFAGPEDE